jgi:F-type H+-transporting ATPase subunit b
LKLRRIFVAALFLLLPVFFAAQDQAKPAPSPTPAPQQQQAQPPSTNQELVEASKGAEQGKEKEEGDEEAQFKYSPSVQWIAKHTGLSTEGAYWVCIVINFLVVAGFIGWAIKKYTPGMFRDRSALIKKALEEARAASEEANRRLSEIENRLAKLDGEIAGMRSDAERAAGEEEQRLKAAAEEDKQRIVTSAEQEIASAAKMARGELKKFAAELAVGLAEKKVQVTPDTDASLVRTFTGELGNERRNS